MNKKRLHILSRIEFYIVNLHCMNTMFQGSMLHFNMVKPFIRNMRNDSLSHVHINNDSSPDVCDVRTPMITFKSLRASFAQASAVQSQAGADTAAAAAANVDRIHQLYRRMGNRFDCQPPASASAASPAEQPQQRCGEQRFTVTPRIGFQLHVHVGDVVGEQQQCRRHCRPE